MAEKKEETTKKNPPKNATGETDAQVRQKILRNLEIKGENYSGRYKSVKEVNYDKPGGFTYKGGFYYDSQLEDPYMSISLHANTKIVDGVWVTWPGEKLEKVSDSPHASEYGVEPIARCIMSEDFSYSIANNFSDYNGGNPIESIFETFKPYAPILGKFGTALKESTSNVRKDGSYGSGAVGWFNELMGKASNIMNAASGYLNKALFVQGTRFSYYNGTSFNFNNMEMKFIVFSDYVNTDPNGDTWVFQSAEDYIKTLQPYVMGVYGPYNADFLSNSGVKGEAREFIAKYVGFQDPPGGFQMDTQSLNNTLKGTLRMNIGGTWAIDNLVIKGMNVNMSRVQAKHPEKEGETVPLYAEISLQLAPAAAIVDTGYRNILDHKGLNNIRGAIKNGYNDKLNELKTNYIGK